MAYRDLRSPAGVQEALGTGVIVVDPEIPEEPRLELIRTNPDSLPPFNTPAEGLRAWAAQRAAADAARRARRRAFLYAAAALLVLGSSLVWGLLAGLYNLVGSRTSGHKLSIMAIIGVGISCVLAVQWLRQDDKPKTVSPADTEKIDDTRPVIVYHGRYVVPSRDLDDECRRIWQRAMPLGTGFSGREWSRTGS